MKKSLLIVQDVPTQFDVPLYHRIHAQQLFDLKVIYTRTATVDSEIGRLPNWDHIQNCDYDHRHLSQQESNNPKNVLKLIYKYDPDHIIISGYWPKLHRDLVRPLKSKGYSLGLRSDNTLQHTPIKGLRNWLKKVYLDRFLKLYDVWHPTGEKASDYLRYLCSEGRPVSLFPYNVDTEWFQVKSSQAREDRQSYLQSYGFDESNYIVLGIMKWHPREAPLTLIEGFKRFIKQQPQARLILVGDGPLRDEVSSQISDLQGLVATPGYAAYSELPKYYGISDVFVHPAPGEPWGVSVSESLASGTPVLASTGVGSAEEQIQIGKNGRIFSAGDTIDLAQQLNFLLEDKQALGKAIHDNCHKALKNWSYSKSIDRFCELLNV